jgi:AAA+ superfamily predicted ATPase
MSDIQEMKELNDRINKRSPATAIGVGRARDEAPPTAIKEMQNSLDLGKVAMWAVSGRIYRPCETAVHTMPSDIFLVRASPSLGIYFERQAQSFDELIHLPDSASDMVLKSIREFWAREQAFREYGFLWKRGILLWGPPGGGKTCTLHLIAREMMERNGLVIYGDCDPGLLAEGLRLLRQIEPARPLVVILEDLDAIVRRHGEPEILSLLDGETQIDNVVFIATTNYPELLDQRLVNRRSRFDVVKKVGMPPADARRAYLKAKNKRLSEHVNGDGRQLERWVEATNRFSIADLKELIILVEVFGKDFDEAVAQLRALMNETPSSDNEGKGPVGFYS